MQLRLELRKLVLGDVFEEIEVLSLECLCETHIAEQIGHRASARRLGLLLSLCRRHIFS